MGAEPAGRPAAAGDGTPAGTGRVSRRAAAAVLILLGAATAAFAATRIWWTASYPDTPVGPYHTSATGTDTVGELVPVALVAIAGWGAALATRGILRRLIGGLVAVAGALLVTRVLLQWGSPPLDILGRTPFLTGAAVEPVRHPVPMVAAAVGGLLVLVGAVLVMTGPSTAPRLSGRYDRTRRPTGAAAPAVPVETDDLWKAQDAGLDPTGDPAADRIGEPAEHDGNPAEPDGNHTDPTGGPVDRPAGSTAGTTTGPRVPPAGDLPTPSEMPRPDDYSGSASGIAGSGPELSNGST